MDKLKALIEKLKGIAGATDLVKDFEAAVQAAEVETDTLKGDASTKKKLESENKRLKADLEAAAGGTDERVTKLTKERDDAVALASKSSADLRQLKLNTKLAEKLGITDPTRQKRALDAFSRDYLPEGTDFDDKGELPGIEKALKTFREKESFYFAAEEAANEGAGATSGTGAVRGAARKTDPTYEDKVSLWEKQFGGESK